MAGTNHNDIVMNDWLRSNHSSINTFWSSFNEDFGSTLFPGLDEVNDDMGFPNQAMLFSDSSSGLPAQPKLFGDSSNDLLRQPKLFGDSLHDVSFQPKLLGESSNDLPHQSDLDGAPKTTSVGGLAERRAARKGFKVPKLDTDCFPLNNVVSSSDIRSPYVTIPAGLSPTSLLDSPVFLSDSLAQQSPTTGKFPSAKNVASDPISISVSSRPTKREDNLFEGIPESFPLKPFPESYSCLPISKNKQLDAPSIEVPIQPEKPGQSGSIEVGCKNFQNQQVHHNAGSFVPSVGKETKNSSMLNQRMSDSFVANDPCPAVDDQRGGEADLRDAAVDTPVENGYNWRKYGQKQVKGSEYPRSYYKCTHPGCQMKKKVERSPEGEITEIIYKGAHNHLPNQNCKPGSDQPGSQTSFDSKPIKGSPHSGNGGQDWLGDGLEATSSAPIAAEYCDPSNSLQWNQDGSNLSPDAIGASSTMSTDEEGDQATHGSVSLGGDGEGDETESKRRMLDACAIEMSAASRAAREPRVVVQLTSDVEILEDGYRWRKYGQKVVKGNQNPRSYYKCTNPGCTVRKHIERASDDFKSVITTYEGRHNHDVPVARGGSHANSAPSNASTKTAPQPRSLLQRHEPTQDSFARFDGRVLPLSTFRFTGRDPIGATTGFPFAMGKPGSTNPPMAGLVPMVAMKMPNMPLVPPLHPYLGNHQPTEAGGFMMPKVEPKEKPAPDTMLPLPNAASVYHQMLSRLPLGHQL